MAVNISDILIKEYMKDLFKEEDPTLQKRRDVSLESAELALERAKDPAIKRQRQLTLESAERASELADLSLLTTMLNNATDGKEINLITQTNETVQKEAVGKDPVIQAAYQAVGAQIEEHTDFYNQFVFAIDNVEGFMDINGEFEDIDVENLSWSDLVKQSTQFRRLQHVITQGEEKGFSYKPEKSKLLSNQISFRLNEHVKQLDTAIAFRLDRGDGQGIPDDARRAIQIGDEVGFERMKARDTSTYRNQVNKHSSRYHSLNTTKMQADTKENKDSGQVPLVPEDIMKELQDKGEEQVKAYMEALKGNPMVYQAFMGGFKNDSGITVDYTTYSKLLDAQMEIEKNYINDANTKFKNYTGENVETFREATSFEAMKEEIDKTGLQVEGVNITDDVGSNVVSPPKVTVPYSGFSKAIKSTLEFSNSQGDYSVQNMIKDTTIPSKTRDVLSRKSTIKKVNKNVEDKIIKLAQPFIQPYHEKMYTSPSARKKIKGQYTGVAYKEKAPQIKFKYNTKIQDAVKKYKKEKAVLDREYPEFGLPTDPHTKKLIAHGNKERSKLLSTHKSKINDLRADMQDELDDIAGIAKTKGLDRSEILKFATQFTAKGGAQEWFKDMDKEQQLLLKQLIKGYKSNLSLIESKAP